MPDTHVLAKGITDYPPLPDVLPERARRTGAGKPLPADGCYFVAYGLLEDTHTSFPNHVGTLRIDSRSDRLGASADLYGLASPASQATGSLPPVGTGIPIFPIPDYRLYLRVTKIETAETGFTMEFEAHRFLAPSFMTLDGGTSAKWALEGAFSAQMKRAAAPPGYPKPELFFVGDVSRAPADADSQPVGQLQIGWVSDAVRRAVVEIDRVPGSRVPQDNGAGLTWRTVFESVGWEMSPIVSDDGVTKSGNPVWTAADVEAARLKYRDSSDLDTEWRYYLLVAQEIAAPGSKFGFMHHQAREALFITSQFVFPQEETQWGTLRGERFDTTVAFFRTALHEMGHAMGLGHNAGGLHFMRPTEAIAREAGAEKPFPANIDWSFAPNDEFRLRHWPDIVVRPGGAAIGVGGLLLPRSQGL